MLRFLCSACAILVLVLSMCLLPQTAAARSRCPVKEPETLLSLYMNSDAIYIAAFDKVVPDEKVETNDDYTIVTLNKHFTVSTTLKGQSRKFFVQEDREYHYKPAESEVQAEAEKEQAAEPEAAEERTAAESEPEEEVSEEEEAPDPNELRSGDTVLLFVNEADKDEAARITDYRDGIKKMSAEDIAVYESRIRELNSIFAAKKVNVQHVIDWLVRCAEEPATRWEGTYELLRSFRFQHWREEAEKEYKDRIAKGLPVEERAEESEEEGETAAEKNGDRVDRMGFARSITGNQKQTLANILLNFASSKTAGKREYVHGDRELIQLVAKWGDPRFVGFLLDQIRNGSADTSDTTENMELVAEILNDSEVEAIAEKYGETMYEDDNDIVAAEEEAEKESVDVEQAEAEPVEKPAPDVPEKAEPDAQANEAPETDSVTKQTYKELRAELVAKFIARCDKVIAGGDRAEDAPAKATAKAQRPSNK